jgi:hypothetical protein
MFGPDNNLTGEVIRTAQKLGLVVHLDLSADTNDLLAARNRLWKLYEWSEECALHNDTSIDEDPYAMCLAYQTVSTSLGNRLCLSYEACPSPGAHRKLVTLYLGFRRLLCIRRPYVDDRRLEDEK